MSKREIISEPVSFEMTIRARLRILLREHYGSMLEASRQVGWPESTMWRRLSLEPGSKQYRPLTLQHVNELLAATGIRPQALMKPVVGGTDYLLLKWLDYFIRTTPGQTWPHLPIEADWSLVQGLDSVRVAESVKCMVAQGLLLVRGDPSTPTGPRTLHITDRARSLLARWYKRQKADDALQETIAPTN